MLRTLRALSVTIAACWFCAAAVSAAERGAEMSFDIPAQSLDGALNAFAETAGVQLSYPGALSEGLRSPALSGRYTVDKALEQLLQNTGLGYRFVDDRTLTLERPDPLAALLAEARRPIDYAQVTPAAPDEPQAPAKKSEDAPTVQPEMTVTAKPTDATSYSVPNATTATKTDTPIMETPASIQVVPRQVIEDQKVTRIQEALENVSGVRPNSSLGSGNRFIVRGFASANVYRNGLLADDGGFRTQFDTATLESIEVLKGPAAVLYGRIEPGGLINLVTKKPLDLPYYSLEQRFGSYDFYRTEWDATGPLTRDKSLLYRFDGGYQNSESFRDFNFIERLVLHPSLTWRPTASTEMTVEVESLQHDFRPDFGIPVIGRRPAPVPISRSYSDPNVPEASNDRTLVGFNLSHNLNESWKLENRFLASFLDTFDVWPNPAPAFGNALRADNRTLDRNIFGQESDADVYSTNLDLTGNFWLGPTRHDILLGFDYLKATTEYNFFGNFTVPNPALAIDLFNPTYGIDPALFTAARSVNLFPGENFRLGQEEAYGAYFQDQITLWDTLHILGGGRYDWAEVASARGGSFAAAEANVDSVTRKDEEFSPRVGILYQAWPWLSVFGDWTTSFGANNGVTAQNVPVPPETGEQFEAGLKTELFDHRLGATLAFYHLTRQNLLTPDLSTPDPLDSIPVGEQRSQGIEFDMAGQITDSVSLIGSYAYTDGKVTEDNSGLEGKHLFNVPEHSGSLWLKYDFKGHAALNGLSIGFGAFAVGERDGDIQNTFLLPGYVRLDAFAGYRWKLGPSQVTAQLNVRNVLDKDYYESADADVNVAPRNGVSPGEPLMLLGSIRVEF